MEKHSTPLMVLETFSSCARPATSAASITAFRSPIRTANSSKAGVVKAGAAAQYTGTGMPFAGLVDGAVNGAITPRVRNNPSGTPTCDPPV
jgi:hypothetical protein